MNKKDISSTTAHRIVALSCKKENQEIINRFIDESVNEEELISKLRQAFPKYNSIQYVLYDGILPTGQMTGGPAYLGEGVPEECPFTPAANARRWQKRINRSPKLREELEIKVLNEKCPYCKRRVFECNGHKWCNGYPDCKFEEEQRKKERQKRLKR